MSSTSSATLAVRGGDPAVTLSHRPWPEIDDRDAERLAEVARSGKWSWIGEHERAFCNEWAAFNGTRYALALANGTVTLQCALQAVGVEPGDEVIVPALTWVATAQAALDIGANVVLVDIDAETLCIDPQAFEAAVTDKTTAVVPVHLYGCMADMDAVMDAARRHDIRVVEDVAHQHGSVWRDTHAGAIGDAGSFSFQQSKVLTCGEGGSVICDDPEVYRCVFALKQVGWAPSDPEADPFGPTLEAAQRYGHNYRMTEMQAALLRGGLERLPEQTRVRDENAQRLAARLAESGTPLQPARRDPRVTTQAYYGMTFHWRADRADGVARGVFLKALAAEGVRMCTPYEPVYRSGLLNLYDRTSPIPYRDSAVVQDYANLTLPATERACTKTACILMHQHLLADAAYVDQVAAAVEKVCDRLDDAVAAAEEASASS